MKIILTLLLTLFLAQSCQNENKSNSEIWWINSAKVDCTGEGPMSCFQVQKGPKLLEGEWKLFYNQIEGFEYEPGFIYQLEVRVDQKQRAIPADASSLSYELVEVISKIPDQRVALTNNWKLLHVGSIKDPRTSKGGGLSVKLNSSQGSYFIETGCNSLRGEFILEGKGGIRFGQGASTMMACPNMEAEMEIKKVLGLIRKFEIENNVLYLRDESGQILMSLRAVD